jgi:UDP-N-acetylmuramoyl-tripeptide--D-alanyl-D-alanine ligase
VTLSLSIAEIAEATGGQVAAGEAGRRFDRFGIDSRAVRPGQLFFAIRGERHDGHHFVAQAIEAGAAGVVASEPLGDLPATTDGAPAAVVMVDDTTAALQRTARAMRRASGARVIAITGSAGKTTTKEVTAAFLALDHRTFRNRGNLNNHIGLPLSLLEMASAAEGTPEMAVLELGMSAPGEIRTLIGIAEPDVRVWTNVGEAHLEHFSSIDAIADAKAEVLEQATRDTLLVANAADARVASRLSAFPGRVRTFAVDAPADVRAAAVRDLGIRGMAAEVDTPAGRTTIETPLVGRGNLANVLAALTVGLESGVALDRMAERARTLTPAGHRGEVRAFVSGVTVIDDAYNSNPLAVERALEVVAAERGFTRRIAVLGEMLELGAESTVLHARCGRAAARAGIDVLVTVGGDAARALGEGAIAAGLDRAHVRHLATSADAAPVVASLVQQGDLVLVKGSRGVKLELVVDAVAAAGSGDGERG